MWQSLRRWDVKPHPAGRDESRPLGCWPPGILSTGNALSGSNWHLSISVAVLGLPYEQTWRLEVLVVPNTGTSRACHPGTSCMPLKLCSSWAHLVFHQLQWCWRLVVVTILQCWEAFGLEPVQLNRACALCITSSSQPGDQRACPAGALAVQKCRCHKRGCTRGTWSWWGRGRRGLGSQIVGTWDSAVRPPCWSRRPCTAWAFCPCPWPAWWGVGVRGNLLPVQPVVGGLHLLVCWLCSAGRCAHDDRAVAASSCTFAPGRAWTAGLAAGQAQQEPFNLPDAARPI